MVIGGMLTTTGSDNVAAAALIRQGYDGVFTGADAVERFVAYLSRVPADVR